MRPLTLRRMLWTCGLLCVTLLAVVVLALRLGAVPFPLADLGQNILLLITGHPEKVSTDFRLIMVDIRLPRILLGILVGAALSVAGASFQALLRNPLADPYVLGVSSGSALGVILALLLAPAIPLMTPLGAFLGAVATIAAVYLMGRREGHLDSGTLLLAGIVSASFLSAVIMFLMTTLASRDLRGIAFWLMGDLSTTLPTSLLWTLADRFHPGGRGDLHNRIGLEFAAGGRTRSHAPGRGGHAREAGGVHFGVVADGAGRFRQRSDRLRGPAGAARDAPAVRLGLPAADSHIGDWRSHRRGVGGHAGANHCGPHGTARGGHDRDGGRAHVYLSAAAEAGMNAAESMAAQSTSTPEARPRSGVRVNVQQASYAYTSPAGSRLLFFTLEATSFQARERELVAILGPNASGKSTLLRLIAGSIAPLSGRVELDGFETSKLERGRARNASPWCSRKARWSSRCARATTCCRDAIRTDARCGLKARTTSPSPPTPWRKWAPSIWRPVDARNLRRRKAARRAGARPGAATLVLLLDEPTLHLDIGAQVELLARLRRLAEENRYTVIVVTHELAWPPNLPIRSCCCTAANACASERRPRSIRRELLEQVFETPLDIETGPEGRPRVLIIQKGVAGGRRRIAIEFVGGRELRHRQALNEAAAPVHVSETPRVSRQRPVGVVASRRAGRACRPAPFTASSAFGKTVQNRRRRATVRRRHFACEPLSGQVFRGQPDGKAARLRPPSQETGGVCSPRTRSMRIRGTTFTSRARRERRNRCYVYLRYF
jgi:ABC-type cobalamin/Fe3+-siderophores transport system ATPase subunit